MKYDGEDLLDDIYAIMIDGTKGLNAKITAVEAEKISKSKGLTPTLASISNYYCQTWSDNILNSSESIFYGIEDVESNDQGANAKTYKVFIDVVLVDNNQTNDSYKRIMRYSRALEELFKTSFSSAIPTGMVKIESVRPVAFRLSLDSDDEVKVGGITLTITLV